MTPNELRALADRYEGSSDERDLMLADLARLCAELGEAASNVFGYIEPRFKVGGIDEGLSVKRLAEALAELAELEAR